MDPKSQQKSQAQLTAVMEDVQPYGSKEVNWPFWQSSLEQEEWSCAALCFTPLHLSS